MVDCGLLRLPLIMHYKNGRKAQIGDQVVGKDSYGNLLAGILVKIHPGTQTCNGVLLPTAAINNGSYITLAEVVHLDDAVFPCPGESEGRDVVCKAG